MLFFLQVNVNELCCDFSLRRKLFKWFCHCLAVLLGQMLKYTPLLFALVSLDAESVFCRFWAEVKTAVYVLNACSNNIYIYIYTISHPPRLGVVTKSLNGSIVGSPGLEVQNQPKMNLTRLIFLRTTTQYSAITCIVTGDQFCLVLGITLAIYVLGSWSSTGIVHRSCATSSIKRPFNSGVWSWNSKYLSNNGSKGRKVTGVIFPLRKNVVDIWGHLHLGNAVSL